MRFSYHPLFLVLCHVNSCMRIHLICMSVYACTIPSIVCIGCRDYDREKKKENKMRAMIFEDLVETILAPMTTPMT
ncbi:uncharacterized protein F4812DRAFT_421717 [Daldinia caldariorum]|uniref:uncharacterized protein n=1 Tax=Daldinia caldariorum TaxID=326644 RepID=UPI0020080C34|nr:uncharacterized protein F4812DRAFT_421717 [Daldinia caldariorum]KAI1470168.1 hypothetical protein F4812DRAFT_421717 [Daldinia caldariorum]